MAGRAKGGQEAAFWRLLVRLELRPVDVKPDELDEQRVAQVALGQVGLALARDLDRPDAFGRAASAKELRSIIEQLAGPQDKPKRDAHHHQPGSWDDPS